MNELATLENLLTKSIRSGFKYFKEINARAQKIQNVDEHWKLTPGFSYYLPKEEQIRSEIYSVLKDQYIVETEWRTFKATKKYKNKADKEIDLVGFSSEGTPSFDFFIEIKRALHLSEWTNKPKENRRDFCEDINKLESIRDLLTKTDNAHVSKKTIFGLIVILFVDDREKYKKFEFLPEELQKIPGVTRKTLWESGEDKILFSEASFARCDLITLN